MSKKIAHIHVRHLQEEDEKMIQELMNALGHKTASKTVLDAVRLTHSLFTSKSKLDDLFDQLTETRDKMNTLMRNPKM